ncbi:hypothetical protein BDQ17DRAFT_1356967 [Cyathus striatus]|nr:hypothetical protein BDQ17DRAFT_1356967 [Cyathus striatus]
MQPTKPINELPMELLQKIFDSCFDVKGSQNLYSVILPRQHVTLTLSQVCKFWRSISLATPRLWTDIHINNPSHVKLWLQRSSNHPLYLTILDLQGRCQDFNTMEIDLKYCPGDQVVRLEAKVAPQLALIIIHHHQDLNGPRQITDTMFSFLSTSSGLRNMRLSHAIVLSASMDINIWSRLAIIVLHEIRMENPTAAMCIKFLSMCTSATHIEFTSPDILPIPFQLTQSSVFLLPRLKNLTLGLNVDAMSILQHFSLPQLKKLYIIRSCAPYDYDAFSLFFSRSNCALSMFRWHFGRFDNGIICHLNCSKLDRVPCFWFTFNEPDHQIAAVTIGIRSRLLWHAINPHVPGKILFLPEAIIGSCGIGWCSDISTGPIQNFGSAWAGQEVKQTPANRKTLRTYFAL